MAKEVLYGKDRFSQRFAWLSHWLTDPVREEGRAEERQEVLEKFRQIVLTIVSQRFPKLKRIAQRQLHFAQNTERLQQLILDLSLIAKNASETEQYLLHFDDEDESIQLE